MPTYTYQCKRCESLLDVYHPMSATPKVKCETCGGPTKRMLGAGAGIIFKGSGFYETDYKRDGNGKSAKNNGDGASEKSEPKQSAKESAGDGASSKSGGGAKKSGDGSQAA